MTDQLEQVLEDLEEVLEEGELLELPEAGAVLPRERTGGDAGAPPLLPETAETGEEATAAGGQAAAPPPAQGPARAETEGEEGPSPGRFPEEGTEPPLERRGSPAAGSGEAAVRGLRAALPAGRAEAYGGGAEGGPPAGQRGALPAGSASAGPWASRPLEADGGQGPGSGAAGREEEALSAGQGRGALLFAQARRARAAAQYAAGRRETVAVPAPAAEERGGLDARRLDRLFQRDARRYDGGFTLY